MKLIKVSVPSQASKADIATLGRFDAIITELWVQLFNLTSNPRWERDPTINTNYYRLMTGSKSPPDAEVLSESIKALNKMTVEEFTDRLTTESWRITRQQSQGNRTMP